MCGIFSLLNGDEKIITKEFIIEQFLKSQSRGPDNTVLNLSNDIYVGFHRLSINGLNSESNQPFLINGIELICNGEIYNYKNLFHNINYKATTNSDCEIIIHLYRLYGMEYTLNLLDGVFAFILIDHNINKIFVARDPYGIRPIYYLFNSLGLYPNGNKDELEKNVIIFASEIKQLSGFCEKLKEKGLYDPYIKPIQPGEFLCLELNENEKWFLNYSRSYNSFPLNNFSGQNEFSIERNIEVLSGRIHNTFCEAVKKRVQTTNRPIACLLSGGLDSSIVTSLVNRYYEGELETFSIGLEGSEDLKNARIVADYLKTNHTEVIVSEEDFFNAIPFVIKAIESYDTTTVRASVGNYLVSRYISEHSEAKVIFNGDGSDELMGGYLYMGKADNHLEFDLECKRLLTDIHLFDVLRSDRSISTNGLEPRTPFLDREFVKIIFINSI